MAELEPVLQRMSRADLTRQILSLVDDDVALVAGIGNASFDLRTVAGERGATFYMLGSMGQAISIGLGLAVAQPERNVVVMEGEGSVLLNMSALATIGMVGPPNLTIVIWDNEQWQITGGQPVSTSATCDLAEVARGCGIASTGTPGDEETFAGSLRYALDAPGPHVVVAKIDGEGAANPRRDDPISIKHQFMKALGVTPD